MRRNLLDLLHRGVVAMCAATTVVGTGFLGYNAGYFVLYVLPERRAAQERDARELLEEGYRAPSTDQLPDIAPTLRG